MNGIKHLLALAPLAFLFCGCDDGEPLPKPVNTVALAEAFDAAKAGTIRGQVRWKGEIPLVPPFHAPVNASGQAAKGPPLDWPNPHRPAIDSTSRGVADVVVFLRGIDPKRSRPWDLHAVRVEMADFNYRVVQGDVEARTGFVRRGEAVEMVSRQSVFHSLRARGAAFFTLAFPDADQPRRRVFDREGVVKLSSAASYYWARAYLFVSDHPYLVRTDHEGNFTLPQVPAGDYEIVFWHPNWRIVESEQDADSWQTSRITFARPVEVWRAITVTLGGQAVADAILSAAAFEP